MGRADLRHPADARIGLFGRRPVATSDRVRRRARAARRLARIVDDLLDVRRIPSGKVEPKKTRIDAGRLLRECCDTRQVVDAGAHVWTVSVAPLWAEADVTRLGQMFDDLLHNAIKYTPAGGAIAVRGHADDGMARIEVADTGTGIGPATLPLIFDTLVQRPVSIDRSRGGLGLGLAVAPSHADVFVDQAVG